MFKTQEVQRYMWEIISAISALHTVGVMHRDIKPGNIFFAKEGRCKLGLLSSFYFNKYILVYVFLLI
jgi:serine/threonine protein kinase